MELHAAVETQWERSDEGLGNCGQKFQEIDQFDLFEFTPVVETGWRHGGSHFWFLHIQAKYTRIHFFKNQSNENCVFIMFLWDFSDVDGQI